MKSTKHIAFLLLLLPLLAWGQELSVQAPSQVSVGQAFYVTFEVNARPQGTIKPSSWGNLQLIQGPMTGQSSSTSWVNGQMSQSISFTYRYMLQATQEGTTTIGPASIVVDGKTLKSEPRKVQVVKGNASMNQQAQQQGRQQGSQPQQPATIDDKNLYARVAVTNANPYKGQEVIITYKIFTKVSLRQYQIDKLPGIKGFWQEDLTGNQIRQYEEGGFAVAEIRRGAIYGQEVGKQTIDPLRLEVLAMVPAQRRRPSNWFEALFDDPFFSPTQAVTKNITSNSLSINVKPLPTVPDGKVHHGGVGSFKAQAEVDQTSMKANEALTLRLTVSGSGNLPLLEAPEVDFPKVFEAYEPKVTDRIQRTNNGLTGSRTFEWVLIPQSAGKYQIPSFDYTWFNPKSGRYETYSTPTFDIEVAKGEGGGQLVSSNKSDVKRLNDDINHIKSRSHAHHDSGTLQLLLLILLPLATLLVVLLGRKRQSLQADEVSLRQHQAMKRARRRLRAAEKAMAEQDGKRFYEEIYKALWGCLSDKYSIPIAQLNHDTVADTLASRHIPEEQHSLVMRTLQAVDEARFAPGDASAHMKDIYTQTLNTIAAL